MVIRTKDNHSVFTKVGVIGPGNWMHESARADVISVAFRLSCSNVFVCAAKWGWVNSKPRSRLEVGLWVRCFHTNITWNGPSCRVGARDTFKAFKKKTFSCVRINVLHHVDKKVLCSISVPKIGSMSTSSNSPVFTCVIELSAFADAFVRQSATQFWVGMWARSWILPEQASFLNIEIMWIVSFCSGEWNVLAVVTRFSASVLMWMSAISPDRSIHNPRRNWHEPKHFMK